MTPDGKAFSTVRGARQELWRFDLDGSNPRLVYAHKGLIGYYVWIDDHRLAVFVLGANGSPAALQLVDTKADIAEVIEPNIGQSLLIRPERRTISFIGRPPGAPAVVKQLDPVTKNTSVIAGGLAGSQYLTWLPDGRMLMASGTKIWAWRDGAAGWTEVGDLGSVGLTEDHPSRRQPGRHMAGSCRGAPIEVIGPLSLRGIPLRQVVCTCSDGTPMLASRRTRRTRVPGRRTDGQLPALRTASPRDVREPVHGRPRLDVLPDVREGSGQSRRAVLRRRLLEAA